MKSQGQRRRTGSRRTATVPAIAIVLAIGLGACSSGTKAAPVLRSPEEFGKRLKDADFGCVDLVVQPRKSTDKATLIARASCHVQQSIAVPSKQDLQNIVEKAKKGEPTTASVAGPVGVFLYRDEASASEGFKAYLKFVCSPPVHPAQVDYYAGKNFWALSADGQVDVLSALDAAFGIGTIHESC